MQATADQLQQAAAQALRPQRFYVAFLISNTKAKWLASPELAANADCHYQVSYERHNYASTLWIRVWHRHPCDKKWNCYYGLMLLEQFIYQFATISTVEIKNN